ncbi:MAG: hypothetical protein E6R03_13230 [Hyphomicrobiaceae bacterium]|nr:MAG: hypothetical protein E6R03_13230 [Hyphomicrobiaceae bacterium]
MGRSEPQHLVLAHNRAPGDIVVMTAFVRDLMLTHPDRYIVEVQTSAMDLWRHNPYVTVAKRRPGARPNVKYLQLDYGRGIRDQNYEPVHFLAYFHRDFERKTGVKIPLRLPYPDLHLSAEERNVSPLSGRYWVVLSGGKSDFTAKVWEAARMQRVADQLGALGLGVAQIGSNDSGHWHPPLQGEHVVNLVGRTNLRDMMRLIHHSDGVICGITCAMHMAAALHRPCVVLAGGREAWWWEAYVRENKGLAPVQHELKVPHQFLHTIGLLQCCQNHGCWKNKVVAINSDKSLCYHPVQRPEQTVPLCLDMISETHVLEAVMKYYTDQTLPPISQSPQSQPTAVTQAPAAAPTPPPAAPEVVPRRMLDLFAPAVATTPDQAARLAQLQQAVTTAAQPQPAACQTPKRNGGLNQQLQRKTTASLRLPASHPLAKAINDGTVKFGVNQGAKLEGRPGQDASQPPKVAVAPGAGTPAVVASDPRIFDHEDIGGKFTACMLFYGPEEYHDLHRRCLESFLNTTPRERIDLRVGSNALNRKSLDLIQRYVDTGVITKHYRHDTNAWKYPVMREMFYDPAHPITTKWILWFDDDSICDRTPAWLNTLVHHIVQNHQRDNAHMFGAPFVWTLQAGQKEWFERRPWYRGKPWRLQNGIPSPNGNKILFCTGGFWALTTEAMRACNIPDPDIGHNGGDVCIGEQLYQGGFRMKSWNAKKQFVNTSSVKRRGDTKAMPGTPGHGAVLTTMRG